MKRAALDRVKRVLNPALHRDWHQKWNQRMREVASEASRYKSAPRYG